jgi:glycosyltransferase involved in cell wall biosynthesis
MYVTAGLSRTAGGPYVSVSELARAVQSNAGWSTAVLGLVSSEGDWPKDQAQWHGLDVRRCEASRVGKALNLASQLQAVNRANTCVVHASGLWDAASIGCWLAPVDDEVPLVLSPRGMLEPWAMQYHCWRKRVARMIWQDNVLKRVSMFHATSQGELMSIRQLGLRQPVAVIPNGIVDQFTRVHPRNTGQVRRCVFLSRLHPKKGIPLLLEAWQAAQPAGWELVIAGYGEDRHVREVKAALAANDLAAVKVIGELRGDEKWRFLGNADLFVLPSYSENFGLAVAEAMLAGLPVITTTGTPWSALKQHALGWWVEPTTNAITEALAEATRLDHASLQERGKRSSDYIRQHYGWPQIGQTMVASYDWLLGRGPLPSEVSLA